MTPRDDIAGLSERLRDRGRTFACIQPTYYHSPDYAKGRELLDEAASKIDELATKQAIEDELRAELAIAECLVAETSESAIQLDALSAERDCHRQMADNNYKMWSEEKARADSLSADRTHLARFVQDLQRALMYWMPGVGEATENETNGRCGDDAQLLAGYEGEFPSECWGDEVLARAAALSARVKELNQLYSEQIDATVIEMDLKTAMQARAVRAEQERDELKHDIERHLEICSSLQQERDDALGLLRSVTPIAARCEASPEIDAARDLVRRLASGPEKIAAASDGEERK